MDQQALTLIMQLPIAVGVFRGKEYTIELANDLALELWGKTREEVMYRPVFEVFPELVSQGFEEILQRVVIEGEPFKAKEQPVELVRNGAKETVYINFSYDPLRNDKGVIEGFIGTGTDVTELVLARKNRDEAYYQLRFRTAVLEAQSEATPDGVLIVDTRGKILLHNRRFVEIWDIPQSVLDSGNDQAALEYAVTKLCDPQAFMDRVNYLYTSDEVKSYDEILFKDGRIIDRHGVPVVADDGASYGWAWYYRDITERKKQESVRRTILESLPQMAWTARPSGEVDYLNERWYEYTGQTEQEALGSGWVSVLSPEAEAEVFKKWTYSLEHGVPYEVELQYRRHDGEYRWHITRAIPIREGNNIVQWVGTCTDIHEFIELQSSLKLQSRVLESMEEGVSLSDENGYILFTNRAEDRMFGYEPGELIGKHVTIQNAYSPEENQEKVAHVIAQIQKHGNWNGQWHNRCKDGTDFYTYSHITSIENGGKTMLVCVQRDITEEMRDKEAIDYQNMLFRTMANNATSSLFMMDKTGYCTFMNVGGEKMFGYTQEEIRQKPLHYLIHHHRPDGSFYPMDECPIDRALPDNFDVRAHRDLFFRKDGTSFPVTCAASPIFDDNGIPVSTIIEVRDITLELEAEQALRRSAEELEQLVQKRTEELRIVNEQLQQFAYAASHDLQEPLRKISFFIDLLQSNLGASLDERNVQIIERVQSTTGRMRALIHNLLDYSNATLGTTAFEEVNINQLVDGVVSDMEATIIEKNAVLDIQKLPVMKGDERQLRQLFHNLISNSLKYSRPDVPPTVTVSCTTVRGKETGLPLSAEEQQKKFYLINISDNGIGFEQKDADKIFNVFTRLHSKTEYKGTGVGLSIVRKVVDNHGGYVTAESQPEQGATFRVYLPIS